MIFFGVIFFLSDLLCLVCSSLGPSMLPQMVLFPLYGSVIFHIYIPHIYIHSSVSGHFCVRAIVNSAAVNIRGHVSF